jgi:hypothetical protein
MPELGKPLLDCLEAGLEATFGGTVHLVCVTGTPTMIHMYIDYGEACAHEYELGAFLGNFETVKHDVYVLSTWKTLTDGLRAAMGIGGHTASFAAEPGGMIRVSWAARGEPAYSCLVDARQLPADVDTQMAAARQALGAPVPPARRYVDLESMAEQWLGAISRAYDWAGR